MIVKPYTLQLIVVAEEQINFFSFRDNIIYDFDSVNKKSKVRHFQPRPSITSTLRPTQLPDSLHILVDQSVSIRGIVDFSDEFDRLRRFLVPEEHGAIEPDLSGEVYLFEVRYELVLRSLLLQPEVDADEHVSLDERGELGDPIHGFLEFVRLARVLRPLKVLGTKRAQQQGKKQVQDLEKQSQPGQHSYNYVVLSTVLVMILKSYNPTNFQLITLNISKFFNIKIYPCMRIKILSLKCLVIIIRGQQICAMSSTRWGPLFIFSGSLIDI